MPHAFCRQNIIEHVDRGFSRDPGVYTFFLGVGAEAPTHMRCSELLSRISEIEFIASVQESALCYTVPSFWEFMIMNQLLRQLPLRVTAIIEVAMPMKNSASGLAACLHRTQTSLK
jgi:hypothetical protein